MSTRMYGRHGPGAWKKWHERRYRQSSPSPRVVVVILHVPPMIERVIVILMPDNDPTGQEPGSGVPGTPGGALATVHSSRGVVEAAEANGQQVRERVDPLGHVGNVAFAAGNRQGTADRERQDVLSADELENEAMRLSSEYTTSENTVGDSDVSDVIDHYEMRYKAGYLRGAKVKSLEDLPETWKRVIQQKAHRDRDLDERKGDARTGDPLLGVSIENALDSIGIRSREQKQRVKEYVSIYLEAYENYTPQERFEQDRGNSFRRS